MRCIYCNADSRFKERRNRTCKTCGKSFAFEPRSMPAAFALTDKAFQAAIEAVSEKGTLPYTARQLYYQLLRSKLRRRRLQLGDVRLNARPVAFVALAALVIGSVLGRSVLVGLALAAAMLLVAFLVGTQASRSGFRVRLAPRPPLTFADFTTRILPAWEKAHGLPKAMLRPQPDGQARSGGAPATDLQHVSFDRILVVDRRETAQALIADNFHFETSTPIVSVDGYPAAVFSTVMGMVRRNPNLRVFTLHDADPEGCRLPVRLREDSAWFPQPNVQIVDVGLRPRQVATMPGLIVQRRDGGSAALPRELDRALAPSERRWLAAGNYVELAAVRPSQLMRAIFRCIMQPDASVRRSQRAAEDDPRSFFLTRSERDPGASGAPPSIVGSRAGAEDAGR